MKQMTREEQKREFLKAYINMAISDTLTELIKEDTEVTISLIMSRLGDRVSQELEEVTTEAWKETVAEVNRMRDAAEKR